MFGIGVQRREIDTDVEKKPWPWSKYERLQFTVWTPEFVTEIYILGEDSIISPFLLAGIGLNINGNDFYDSFAWKTGAGVAYWFAEKFAVDAGLVWSSNRTRVNADQLLLFMGLRLGSE